GFKPAPTLYLLPLVFFLFSPLPVLAKEPPVWLGEIPPQFSREVDKVVHHPTFVRRPKPQTIGLSAEFYGFLLQDWDLAYRLAKVLGIKGYEVQKLNQGWRVRLNSRTLVDVLSLVHKEGRSSFIATGEHRGRVIQHLKLKAFFLIEYRSLEGKGGSEIKSTMTSYIRIEQFLLAAIAKITIPFVGERIDRKLAAILQDVERISRKIHEDPAAVREAVEKSSQFTPAEKQALKKYL
ncbi:MAG: hypothetical protein HYS56_04190, partial [Candidatus Omnitrophica bacterium]|nr:hypothetical protein [Candidatus Omnitrophota bacterium]